MKRLYWYLSILGMLLMVWLGAQQFGAIHSKYQDLEEVVMYGIDGKPVQFRFDEKPYTVIIGWAQWCRPCLDSIPYYNQLSQKFGQQFKFYGIHFDPLTASELKELQEKHGISFPIYRVDKTPPSIWRIGKVPYMLIFTQKGTLLIELSGTKDKHRGERLMERLSGIVDS